MKIKTILFLAVLFISSPAWAGSPNYVDTDAMGRFYTWSGGRIEIWIDSGDLSSATTHDAAVKLVTDACLAWTSAKLTYGNVGEDCSVPSVQCVIKDLGADIDEYTYQQYFIRPGAEDSARKTVIIFDKDGKIMQSLIALGYVKSGAEDTTWALTDIYAVDSAMHIVNGTIILNGPMFMSTKGKERTQAVMMHEFGHLLNLDHSAANDETYTSLNCSNDEAGCVHLPTMYKYIKSWTQETPEYDDKAWASYLYNYLDPNSNIIGKFCRVMGVIKDIKGRGFQGIQVTATEVGNERDTKVTSITGSFYSRCAVDNAGRYILMGLRPGKTYKITYGSIPDWCTNQASCDLSSGINPYAPPRQIDDGGTIRIGGNDTFTCANGGELTDAGEIILSEDLDDDVYKNYVIGGDRFTCEPGVGETQTPTSSSTGSDSGSSGQKKGWCSLLPDSKPSPIVLLFFLPIAALVAWRRKVN